MNLAQCREEMDIYGFTKLGSQLLTSQVKFFRDNLLEQQRLHIVQHGMSMLDSFGEREMLRNCARFHPNYLQLIDADWLNDFVNAVLNDKAILHGYHGILTDDTSNGARALPLRFHRDAPWFKDTRTCVLILMPLVDFTIDVGPTELVPATHRMAEQPSEPFMERHRKRMLMPAGHVFAMDGTLWHRAGRNQSGKIRPMLQMNITLAFMKQQIDVWAEGLFNDASERVKSRLGYNVRSYVDPDEMLTLDRKWKSGNYDTTNVRIP